MRKPKKPVFNTLFTIYSDISTFQTRLEQGLPIPKTSVLQELEDLDFAKELVRFLKSGSYLTLKQGRETAMTVLSCYRSGFSASRLVELTGMTIRQVYYASNAFEDSLLERFPTGLLSLWQNRQFEIISEYISLDSSEISTILDTLTNLPLMKALPTLKNTNNRSLFGAELVQECSVKEIADALEKVVELNKEIVAYLDEFENQWLIWGSLLRYQKLNKTIPAALIQELRLRGFPEPKVHIEKVEGIE